MRLLPRRNLDSLCRHYLKRTQVFSETEFYYCTNLIKNICLRSNNNSELRDKEEEEDYSLLLDDTDSGRSTTDGYLHVNKDTIAEPLYTLLEEIFDLRGVFRWLQRSLITFVQITYGRTINRYSISVLYLPTL